MIRPTSAGASGLDGVMYHRSEQRARHGRHCVADSEATAHGWLSSPHKTTYVFLTTGHPDLFGCPLTRLLLPSARLHKALA